MTALHPYTGRDNAVPCREIGCRRPAWRDDALCDPHATIADRAEASPPPAPGDGETAPPPGPLTGLGVVSPSSLGPSQHDVELEDRTPEWWAYHQLVIDECRGQAPEGTTDRLAEDPFRWAAHLGCAAGEISEQLRSRQGDERWRATARSARHHLFARKADVVALRKRHRLHVTARRQHQRIEALVATVRKIAELAEQGDTYALLDIADLARAAITRPTSSPDPGEPQGEEHATG